MAGYHTRANIPVEGPAEETFVWELLAPHLGDAQTDNEMFPLSQFQLICD
jgi:hypothetical protein